MLNSSGKKFKKKYFSLYSLLILLAQFPFVSVSADSLAEDTVYAIVNHSIKQSSISRNGLSAIFKMRLRQWSDGSTISVFVLGDDNPIHKQFCKNILNVFPHQMRRSWNKLVFSGTGQEPMVVADEEEMIEKVGSTPGAVGYLNGKDITENIKVLEIE